MSPFRAERDTRYDFYFSADILDALTELDKTYLAPPARDDFAQVQRQGFELAIKKIAKMFGYSYSPSASQHHPMMESAVDRIK